MENTIPARLATSFLADITTHMPGGLVVYHADAEEKIIYVNEGTLHIYGCETKEAFLSLVGGSFRGMVYPEDLEVVEQTIRMQIESNTDDQVSYRIRRADGQMRWVQDYGHFVATKEYGDLFYVFIYDITDVKLAEKEAHRAAEELANAKNLNKAKNAFIFNLSHDIRTPMNAILGYIDLARRHKNEAAAVEEHLEKANRAGIHMLTLIDELLELAEVDAAQAKLKPSENVLAKIVQDAVMLVEPKMRSKSITQVSDLAAGEETVMVDPTCLHRVLSHILSNAIKFTPDGGRITTTITRGEISETGYARFAVSIQDTGIGMSEEFQKKAFDAFEREATSTESGHFGTGIGLTVSRRIVEMMGGSIEVSSVKDKGSTFTIALPLKICDKNVQEEKAEVSTEDAQEKTQRRILVVEDIELNRMLAETVLTESGFLVDSVPDGCDAVDTVLAKPAGYYDAILMDIQMPIMNGYEATKAIRAQSRKDLKKLPIIALSANARPEDTEASYASGMNAHVAKPFDVEGLVNTLYKYMHTDDSKKS
ncbi:MAG: response regulator [Desulfovibrionaceae bacterium]|nr:response regulator [Desulfovibrionaceae bacterium]